ncbi:MAG: hypothetical protein KZQ90_08690 [Candidatus Thiodiazotropha sp. (ex Codakia rugifera)]|nr:hypothetical protein [Candidatus Thiodiazotropha sp. (ex Codakia rugifera)]
MRKLALTTNDLIQWVKFTLSKEIETISMKKVSRILKKYGGFRNPPGLRNPSALYEGPKGGSGGVLCADKVVDVIIVE